MGLFRMRLRLRGRESAGEVPAVRRPGVQVQGAVRRHDVGG
jgi:hypothetical protein